MVFFFFRDNSGENHINKLERESVCGRAADRGEKEKERKQER